LGVFSIAACDSICLGETVARVSAAGNSRDAIGEDDLIEAFVPGADEQNPPTLDAVRGWREWLLSHGYVVDRCGQDLRAGRLTIATSAASTRQLLLDTGFRILSDAQRDDTGGVATQSQYFDPSEIASMLAQVAADHPAIARVFSIGSTTQGRSIWAIEISNQPNAVEDEPAIQFNAQHHAREVATSHIGMDVVTTLTNGYGVDSQITAWVDNYTTVVVPMVNPDGVQFVFNGNSSWRKNRMTYSCIGVDLNRNYPYLWGPGCGSSSTCTSDIYRGPSSASELETRAMMALQDQYHFVMATSYHSFGQFIDYPYACSNGSPAGQMPEHPVIDEMMHGVSDGIFAVDGTRYDVNSPVPAGGVNGDDTSWYYAHRGVYSFIIEVGTSFEPPFSQVAGIVNQNRGGWKYMYDRLGKARIDVHVHDACGGSPLEATVTLTNYVFDTGELPRVTSLPYGRWTYVVPANGTYTVRASKAGYVTQDVSVPVANVPVGVSIDLQPETPPPGGCVSADVPATSTYGLVAMTAAIIVAAGILVRRSGYQA
jgi:hypothetical protein